jgi:hypothetical protein
MNLRTALQRDFSPYEIALIGRLLGFGIGAAAMAALALGRVGIALLLILAVFLIVFLFIEFSRCPQCAKDPMTRSKQGVHWFLLYGPPVNYRYRFWPERECSECRFRLDDHPPFDGAAK